MLQNPNNTNNKIPSNRHSLPSISSTAIQPQHGKPLLRTNNVFLNNICRKKYNNKSLSLLKVISTHPRLSPNTNNLKNKSRSLYRSLKKNNHLNNTKKKNNKTIYNGQPASIKANTKSINTKQTNSNDLYNNK